MISAVPHHNSLHQASGTQLSWKKLVRAMLPEFYDLAKHNSASTYEFFKELRLAVHTAHKVEKTDFLLRAYAFVYWSFDHPNKDLWNPAGVCFLEHAFENGMYESVVPWLRLDMLKEALELDEYMNGKQRVKQTQTESSKKGRFVDQVNITLQSYLNEAGAA